MSNIIQWRLKHVTGNTYVCRTKPSGHTVGTGISDPAGIHSVDTRSIQYQMPLDLYKQYQVPGTTGNLPVPRIERFSIVQK